jgi:lipoyl(octanoyl) transferase
VSTLGRNASDEPVLWSEERLRARGVAVHHVGRGGDVTYHGPGQLVVYPILRLAEDERDVRRYVGTLEEMMIRTADDLGVTAKHVPGLRGIWVKDNKLGAVGVRIARWTTLHGLALNVHTTLEDFGMIVPCGLHGRGVTSLTAELGRHVSLGEASERLVAHASLLLNRALWRMSA